MHEDQRYIDVLRTGNPRLVNEALSEIYSQYHDRIIKMVMNNSGSQEDGEEIFQNCMIAIYTKACRDKHFSLNASLYTYLFSVALNLWRRELRKRKQNLSLTKVEESVLKGDPDEIEEILEILREARQSILFWEKFDQLGDKCKMILKHYFEGMAIKEIAQKLNYSNGSARVMKSRCKEKLVAMIRNDERYEDLTE